MGSNRWVELEVLCSKVLRRRAHPELDRQCHRYTCSRHTLSLRYIPWRPNHRCITSRLRCSHRCILNSLLYIIRLSLLCIRRLSRRIIRNSHRYTLSSRRCMCSKRTCRSNRRCINNHRCINRQCIRSSLRCTNPRCIRNNHRCISSRLYMLNKRRCLSIRLCRSSRRCIRSSHRCICSNHRCIHNNHRCRRRCRRNTSCNNFRLRGLVLNCQLLAEVLRFINNLKFKVQWRRIRRRCKMLTMQQAGFLGLHLGVLHCPHDSQGHHITNKE